MWPVLAACGSGAFKLCIKTISKRKDIIHNIREATAAANQSGEAKTFQQVHTKLRETTKYSRAASWTLQTSMLNIKVHDSTAIHAQRFSGRVFTRKTLPTSPNNGWDDNTQCHVCHKYDIPAVKFGGGGLQTYAASAFWLNDKIWHKWVVLSEVVQTWKSLFYF